MDTFFEHMLLLPVPGTCTWYKVSGTVQVQVPRTSTSTCTSNRNSATVLVLVQATSRLYRTAGRHSCNVLVLVLVIILPVATTTLATSTISASCKEQ